MCFVKDLIARAQCARILRDGVASRFPETNLIFFPYIEIVVPRAGGKVYTRNNDRIRRAIVDQTYYEMCSKLGTAYPLSDTPTLLRVKTKRRKDGR